MLYVPEYKKLFGFDCRSHYVFISFKELGLSAAFKSKEKDEKCW
jgi:hypothetical protein